MPDGKDPANPAPANPVDAAAAQQKQMTKAAAAGRRRRRRRQGQRPGALAALPGRSRRHDQLELRREDRGRREAGDHRAAQGHDGRRARRRTHRRGQRLRHHRPAGARRQVRADRHRRRDPRPDPHLRLARRRRPARAHRAVRRRPRHHRHHRDDRVHGHRVHHADARDDDRARASASTTRCSSWRATAASSTTPTTARRRPASPSGTAGSAVVFAGPHRADRPLRPLRGRDPVPHHDGHRRRGDGLHRGAGGADAAAGDPRPDEVQGLRRPRPSRPPQARRRRQAPQQRGPLGTLHRPQAGRRGDPRRGGPRRPRDPAEGPAPRVPQRQHRLLADHAAQGLRPDRRLLRPGSRRSAAGRRGRSRRSADAEPARRRTARSPAGPPTRRASPTPRSSRRTRTAPAPRCW